MFSGVWWIGVLVACFVYLCFRLVGCVCEFGVVVLGVLLWVNFGCTWWLAWDISILLLGCLVCG